MTAIRTVAGNATIVIAKRSSANSGGTSSAPAIIPHDSNLSAATATVLAYTANPTLGTLVGNISVPNVFIGTGSALGGEPLSLIYGDRPAMSTVLRGTGEVLAINLNAATIAGGSFNIRYEWTEE